MVSGMYLVLRAVSFVDVFLCDRVHFVSSESRNSRYVLIFCSPCVRVADRISHKKQCRRTDLALCVMLPLVKQRFMILYLSLRAAFAVST